jgi:isopentenyl diphosphate isomerase/L-lactate dehydrogenase-like FMN-dependent dehydrogenase
MVNPASLQNIDDLAQLARRRIPANLYDFIDRGAEDEVTTRMNGESMRNLLFRQRVGIDVSKRDISTTLFGVKLAMPLGIAVTAMSGLIAHDGERHLARAAAAAGVPYMLGTANLAGPADLMPICGELLWRQVYIPKRRAILDHYVDRAEACGVRVLVVTLDSPVMGNREYLRRGAMTSGRLSLDTVRSALGAPHWCVNTLLRYLVQGGLPDIADLPPGDDSIPQSGFFFGKYSGIPTADDFDWDDVRALRRRWGGVLVLKGVSCAEDAQIALDCGADGLIVSNHGGRSLDGSLPTMQALREVVDAAGKRAPVMVDGGFRRGADVVKAIALGAAAVFVGRATLFGLAAGGGPGAARALEIFREEIDRTLALVGCRSLAELGRHNLAL